MYYFGTNLENRFSVKGFWPTTEQSHKIPDSKEEIDQELSRMRVRDSILREKRLQAAVAASDAEENISNDRTSSQI